MMSLPLVSIVTPTSGRQHLMPALYQVFCRQTYPNTELIIFEDGPTPSDFLSNLEDPRVRYLHVTNKITTGNKRNTLIDQARGDVIAFFDDDDYYAPNYLEAMLEQMAGAEIIKLSNWFTYSTIHHQFFYWDTEVPDEHHFKVGKRSIAIQNAKMADMHIRSLFTDGYGFSYVFSKSVALDVRFPDMDFGEDIAFLTEAKRRGRRVRYLRDQHGLALHFIHGGNLSQVFPQYRLPSFLIDRIFPGLRETAHRQFFPTLL